MVPQHLTSDDLLALEDEGLSEFLKVNDFMDVMLKDVKPKLVGNSDLSGNGNNASSNPSVDTE